MARAGYLTAGSIRNSAFRVKVKSLLINACIFVQRTEANLTKAMSQINQQIEELKKIYRKKTENYVAEFEGILAEIECPIKDANVVTALISLLDDDAEHAELMNSIVYTAEASDDETYSLGIINALLDLWDSSPYWLQIIHV